MFPIWLTLFFGAVVMMYTAVETPRKAAEIATISADVDATNFFAYRRAVQRYLQANPAATGTVADTSLAAYWLTGYIRNPNWTNFVDGGALYVYSTATVAPATLHTMWDVSSENTLVGTKNPTGGRLISFNGFDTGIMLPANIPNNAVVIMGR